MSNMNLKVKEHLHPTKGWKKGWPRMKSRMVRAIRYSDDSVEWETPNPKKERLTGGIFSITKPAEV